MERLHPNTPELAIAIDIFKQHPLATLILNRQHNDDSQVHPPICHLPFLYNEIDHCFYLHTAANNPVVELLNQGQSQVTVIFQGEHGYVSPTWSEHIRVPTWDYCVVHIEGGLEIIEDPQSKFKSMVEQVAANEDNWQLTSLKHNRQVQLFKAIKVMRVNIRNMSYRYKMSQNKHLDAKAAMIENFTNQGKHTLVARYKDVF